MTRIATLLFGMLLMTASGVLQAQMVSYEDSASFDNDLGRLRDIDFENVFNLTVDRIQIHNPFFLSTYAMADSVTGDPTGDILLEVAQGCTFDFPTRTRHVRLEGFSHGFYATIETFTDSVYTLDLQHFPLDVANADGIRKIQLMGVEDGLDYFDINWRGPLYSITVWDNNDSIIAFSNFDQFPNEHYFFLDTALDAELNAQDAFLYDPIEIGGITIHEPTFGFWGQFMYEFEARVDPDNPIGNVGVFITDGATFDFPEGTEGVLLTLEQLYKTDSLIFEGIDYLGNRDTVMVVGAGREYDTTWVDDQQSTFAHVGFSSPDGIQQVKLLAVWYPEVVDFRDTIIDGEYVEIREYGPAQGSIAVTAVHLAETPPTEISSIHTDVDDISNAGYLSGNEEAALASLLQQAELNARNGASSLAIDRLEEFKDATADLYANGRLVVEEEASFRDNADYVISRLQNILSDVPHRQSEMPGQDVGVLRLIDLAGESIQVAFRLPVGAEGKEMLLTSIGGRVEQRIDVGGRSEGDLHLELRQADGSRLPAGSYIVTLRSSLGSTSLKVVVR